MGGPVNQSDELQLDATQQILAAYGAVTTIHLDLILEKSVIDLAELRQRFDAVLRDAPALQPHGARAIQSQLSALTTSVLLRSVPLPGRPAQ